VEAVILLGRASEIVEVVKVYTIEM